MKFLIWFVYLASASILNSLLLSLVDTSASLQGVMLFSFFITVAVYGAAIFFAKTTCNWYAKKKNKCTPMQFVPSTRITQVPTSQEIVEVYRQPKNRVALSHPTGTILVLLSCLICLLSIGLKMGDHLTLLFKGGWPTLETLRNWNSTGATLCL